MLALVARPGVRRRRFKAPVARAHPWGTPFTSARGVEAAQLPLVFQPHVERMALGIAPPDVAHRDVASMPRSAGAGIPRFLRGELGEALVSVLTARTSHEAVSIARGLLVDRDASDPDYEPIEKACALALGIDPLEGRWGDDTLVDWIRARQLHRARVKDAGPPRWLGILPWLGRNAEHWHAYFPALGGLRLAPTALAAVANILPLGVAALTSVQGPRATLEDARGALVKRLAPDWKALLRTLVLRCALEGTFVPGSLKSLVPGPRSRGAGAAEAWRPLLLARRALVEDGHVVGAAHLTAALVATDVRRRIVNDLRLNELRARVTAWGSRGLDDKEAEHIHAAIHSPQVRSFNLHGLAESPWPADWGGPDAWRIERALAHLLDGDVWLAREVFLHDGLAAAAVYALGGHSANALATLGATRTPAGLSEARSALAAAIHRGVRSPAWPLERPPGREAEAAYRQLCRLPEPSLALGTPYWLLRQQRPEAQHALQSTGRLQQFRDLRLVLDRPDVAKALGPYWLLREDGDFEESLIGLACMVGRQLPSPTRDECLRFLRSRL